MKPDRIKIDLHKSNDNVKYRNNIIYSTFHVIGNNLFKIKIFCVLIFLFVLFSCNENQINRHEKNDVKNKISTENVNKELIEKDKAAIENFIKRKQWDMQVTETGLWYMIYKKGSGVPAFPGKQAVIRYQLSLLDGTLCYKSDSLSPKIFKIGHGGVESGLEEGILLLHKGDKAKFILPPHLAHGLLGDENKIPGRATIVYDIEVLDICN